MRRIDHSVEPYESKGGYTVVNVKDSAWGDVRVLVYPEGEEGRAEAQYDAARRLRKLGCDFVPKPLAVSTFRVKGNDPGFAHLQNRPCLIEERVGGVRPQMRRSCGGGAVGSRARVEVEPVLTGPVDLL